MTRRARSITRSRKHPGEAPGSDSRVGAEIKQLRKAKSMTIADLSLATGLSAGYLSQIERDLSRPSVKALHTLSRALGVTVSFFFSAETGDGGALRDLVVRAGARRTLTFENGIRDELLSPNLGRKLELLRSVFPPGASSGAEPYVHRGEEAGFVIAGQLRLWIGKRDILLEAGDSFAFSSDEPHRYANPGKTETVVVWAITPPSY